MYLLEVIFKTFFIQKLVMVLRKTEAFCFVKCHSAKLGTEDLPIYIGIYHLSLSFRTVKAFL